MKQTLNIDNFIRYATSTGKYNDEQLEYIEEALYLLEADMAKLPISEYGYHSHIYIHKNLTQCGKKLQVYMMTCGLKQAKATSAVSDFKKWMKTFMD